LLTKLIKNLNEEEEEREAFYDFPYSIKKESQIKKYKERE
jgi:hypothetical protein